MKAHCHWLIAKTAREFAGAYYEDVARDNIFYRRHPNQNAFIAAHWGKFVEKAREILARMLAMEGTEHMKEQIAEALILDRQYAEGRRKYMLPNVATSNVAPHMINGQIVV